ncbi:SH3 domain-containing protein [Oryzomonas sagensis]|uniref:SH3 domain-containing protein n=1 Tax=Oryzomonas sagensis TaxID=2603857 RepID=UPI001785A6DE|nr:SH3 domain-containing protein [Oryzomonas sagensis]
MSSNSLGIVGMKDLGFEFEPPSLKYLKEFQTQQDFFKNVVEPPALKHLKEFQRNQYDWLKNIVEPPFLKHQQELQRQYEQWRKVFDLPFQTLATNLFQTSEIRKALESPVTNIFKQFQSQKFSFPITPLFMSIQSIHRISSEYQKIFDAQKYLDFADHAFPERIATEMMNRLETLHYGLDSTTADPESIITEEINALAELLLNECKKLPKKLISFEAMIGYVLTILTFLYCLHSGNMTEENIMNRLSTDKAEVLQAISELHPQVDNNKHYVVDRIVNLRVKPNSKSQRFGALYPNQRVTLLKQGGKWIYIEYFDYRDGVPRCGWVFKKYLHLLK